MAKYLVTGANGFVGSHLVEYFAQQGRAVIATDTCAPQDADNLRGILNSPNVEYVQADIRSEEDILKFYQFDISVIYHLASVVGVRHYMTNPLTLIDVVVLGTRNIVRMCHETGARLVFTSTSEIYGRNKDVPWNEDADRVVGSTKVDRWSYSTSKAVCEHMLFACRNVEGFEFSIVRFFNVYGPRQNPIYVVSQSVHRVLNGISPDVYDGGGQTRCFTYIADVLSAMDLMGTHPGAVGEVFNIGFPEEHTIRHVVDTIVKEVGSEIAVNEIDTRQKYGAVYEDIDRRIPDVSKVEKVLSWRAQTVLEEGIAKTVAWARDAQWWLDLRRDT